MISCVIRVINIHQSGFLFFVSADQIRDKAEKRPKTPKECL